MHVISNPNPKGIRVELHLLQTDPLWDSENTRSWTACAAHICITLQCSLCKLIVALSHIVISVLFRLIVHPSKYFLLCSVWMITSFWRDIQSLNWMRRGGRGDACFLFFCMTSNRGEHCESIYPLISFQVGYPAYSGAENVSAPAAEDEQEEGHSGKRTRAALLLSRPWRWYVSRWIFPPICI